MGTDERDRVPLGHFAQQMQEPSQSGRRHGDRLGLPARALNLSAADALLGNHCGHRIRPRVSSQEYPCTRSKQPLYSKRSKPESGGADARCAKQSVCHLDCLDWLLANVTSSSTRTWNSSPTWPPGAP